jgi:DNA repair protein RadC
MNKPGFDSGVSAAADLPRERLRLLGVRALSDAELLALLLRTGGAGASALSVARDLLDRFGGLRRLAQAAPRELSGARCVGPAKSASLLAALEIGRRAAEQRLSVGQPIQRPEDVHRHFYLRLREARQECFTALLLDGRHRLIGEELVSRGTLTASLVHPREVFRRALREAAAALVLVHNHPSGDPSPSPEDREVTERLVRAGELLGVRVVDHVIVAERGYHSFREAGELSESNGGRAPAADRQKRIQFG